MPTEKLQAVVRFGNLHGDAAADFAREVDEPGLFLARVAGVVGDLQDIVAIKLFLGEERRESHGRPVYLTVYAADRHDGGPAEDDPPRVTAFVRQLAVEEVLGLFRHLSLVLRDPRYGALEELEVAETIVVEEPSGA